LRCSTGCSEYPNARAREHTNTHTHKVASGGTQLQNQINEADEWVSIITEGIGGLFRVHLFNYFCRIVFLGCWKEETVSITILVRKTQISFHLFFELFANVLLQLRSSRAQGFMSRSRHIVTSQRAYGCFRKWVDTRRNVSME